MAGGIILLMVQIDDAPGELLGDVIRQASEMGAKNVQLLSSLAKKGRPGHVLLLDILAEQERDFAALLVGELGVWGYRVLHSDHKHFDIARHDTVLEVEMPAGGQKSFPIRIKRVLDGQEFLRVKAEFDEMRDICAVLRAEGVTISTAVLKAKVETAIGAAVPTAATQIALT